MAKTQVLNLSVNIKNIVALRMWQSPTGEVTVADYLEVIQDLGSALSILEVDWRDDQLQNSMQAMKSFIDQYKVAFGLNHGNEEFAEVVTMTNDVLVRADNLMKANTQSWRENGYNPPFAQRRKGRKR